MPYIRRRFGSSDSQSYSLLLVGFSNMADSKEASTQKLQRELQQANARKAYARLTEAFCKEFDQALYADEPANVRFHTCMAIIKKHKLMYIHDCERAVFFLTHLENRGKLMLSPHNVHKNAADILSSGADTDQLMNAYAFELPQGGERREAHIKANQMLIERAQGLVAPIA